jgi:hypothetical protein
MMRGMEGRRVLDTKPTNPYVNIAVTTEAREALRHLSRLFSLELGRTVTLSDALVIAGQRLTDPAASDAYPGGT